LGYPQGRSFGSGYFRAKPSPAWIPQQFSNLVIIHLPAYEDGTDSVPKRRHIKFRCRGITQKKTYNIIKKLFAHNLNTSHNSVIFKPSQHNTSSYAIKITHHLYIVWPFWVIPNSHPNKHNILNSQVTSYISKSCSIVCCVFHQYHILSLYLPISC